VSTIPGSQPEFSQPLPQMAQELSADLVRDAQVAFHQAIKILPEKYGRLAVAGGTDLCRSNRFIEQAQLAEEFACAKGRLMPVFEAPLPANSHLAFEQQIYCLPDLTFIEDHFAGEVLTCMQQTGNNTKFPLGEIFE
jgi:hypothetical protein